MMSSIFLGRAPEPVRRCPLQFLLHPLKKSSMLAFFPHKPLFLKGTYNNDKHGTELAAVGQESAWAAVIIGMIEKRWSVRQPLRVDVDIRFAGGHVHGRSMDIGLGGMFVETDAFRLAPDGNVTLRFHSQSAGIAASDLHARVVRLCDHGVGVMFQDFDADAYRSLKSVMSYA